MKERCHLVYALAPDDVSAGEADDLFNEYIADRTRGLCVYHDHFIGQHGGIAIFVVRTENERDALAAPGPLEGWRIKKPERRHWWIRRQERSHRSDDGG